MSISKFISREDLAQLVRWGWTDEMISKLLQEENPGIRGISSRSVKRVRHEWSIYTVTKCTDAELDGYVVEAIKKVKESSIDIHVYIIFLMLFNRQIGHERGAVWIKGFLRFQYDVNVSIPRILDSMGRVAPAELDARRTFARRRLSRRSLYAPYFGYQLSIDQNEKLREYGITYFAGVDACSRYVVFLFAAPSKNAITLYDQGYRVVLIICF